MDMFTDIHNEQNQTQNNNSNSNSINNNELHDSLNTNDKRKINRLCKRLIMFIYVHDELINNNNNNNNNKGSLLTLTNNKQLIDMYMKVRPIYKTKN